MKIIASIPKKQSVGMLVLAAELTWLGKIVHAVLHTAWELAKQYEGGI